MPLRECEANQWNTWKQEQKQKEFLKKTGHPMSETYSPRWKSAVMPAYQVPAGRRPTYNEQSISRHGCPAPTATDRRVRPLRPHWRFSLQASNSPNILAIQATSGVHKMNWFSYVVIVNTGSSGTWYAYLGEAYQAIIMGRKLSRPS